MPVRKLEHTFFQEVISELRMALEYIKVNVSASAELRVTFAMQVIGMMINNTALLVVWIFFFAAFGQINGWSGQEVVALQGFVAASYGISFTLFSGASDLPRAINNGVFDSILLTPRNLYMRILTITTRTSAVGDMLYGMILVVGYAIVAHLSVVQFGLLISLLIPATVILTNFSLISSCIGFFVPDSDEISKTAFELVLGPSLYPSGVYQGATRVILLFVLPAIAIGGLPVEAVREIDLLGILIVWFLAGAWTVATLFVLRQGVKRYESGNLTGARI